MKVLIVKLSSLGDVVHTLPALQALRAGLGGTGAKVTIDWLVEEAASGILKGLEGSVIDEVIVVKRGWLRNYSDNMRKARELAKRDYDVVLDFQGLLKSAAWVYLTKGRRRIGFANAREGSAIFLNEKLAPYDPEKHAVLRYLDLARYAGGLTTGEAAPIPVNSSAAKRVEKMLAAARVDPKAGYFVLVPRARWATKLWDDAKFAELARRLAAKTGYSAIIAGGRSDRAGIEAMRDQIGGSAVNLAGSTELVELVELMRNARFVVSVDSGPMHVAAGAGAKVIAIFGPTAPWRTGPYGKDNVVLRKGLDCSPCFKKNCSEVLCMKQISVEDVYSATLKAIGQ